MKSSMFSPRTWDGTRWLFVLLAVVFAGVVAWLVLHEGLLQLSYAPLLFIPACACVGLLSLALLASDRRLKRVATFFVALS